MTVPISEAARQEIAGLSHSLGRIFGLDPAELTPLKPEGPPGFFPALSPDILAAIEKKDIPHLLAQTIDHTLLKPEAAPEQIETLCREALSSGFYAVCVNGVHVAQAAALLAGSGVRLAATVGFPLGQTAARAKVYEAAQAVRDGAVEVDMVLNVGWLKSGRLMELYDEILDVVQAASVPVKVILETGLLNDREKAAAGIVSLFARAAFLKTSTGFSAGGATEHDVALLRAVAGGRAGVKASGGVRTFDQAVALLKAGANRIGTSSGVAILGGTAVR